MLRVEPVATRARASRLSASTISLVSLLRGLPWLFAKRPRTPLRVLCLVAFDTIHALRYSRRIAADRLQTLASLLDLGAAANNFFDNKNFSWQDYLAIRRLLGAASRRVAVTEYIARLRKLERLRPDSVGHRWQQDSVQAYRESVVRLSLGMFAATALDDLMLEEGIQATYCAEDLEILYRIAMLCQVIDDVLDRAIDADSGLPSFLTTHASPSAALSRTYLTIARYTDRSGLPNSPQLFPFRVVLRGISILARFVVLLGRWRHV